MSIFIANAFVAAFACVCILFAVSIHPDVIGSCELAGMGICLMQCELDVRKYQ